MSERPLFEALAEVAREQHELEREDPKLAAWQRGELTAEEAARLEVDPLDRALFQPVSPDRKAELAQKVIAPKVVRLLRWPWITALAASIVFAVVGAQFFLRVNDPLPPYTMSISSGARGDRSDVLPSAVPVFERNTTLQLILRPDRETTAPGYRAFLVRGDQWTPWAPPVSVDPSGAMLVEGQTSSLLSVEPGEWKIVFVLAPANEVEDLAARVARGDIDALQEAVVLEQKILVQ